MCVVSETSTISSDILARYAADAVLEVEGVRGLVESHLPRHKGVRVSTDDGRVRLELHLIVDWGASIPEVGREVQQRVGNYVARMTDADLARVDVVVDGIAVS